MTKSELVALLTSHQSTLSQQDVDDAVKILLQQMSDALAAGQRIEIRGFGSFSLHARPPRLARNPRTGAPVAIPARHSPHFKPGKELRQRVNAMLVT
ncbi:MAG: integration host factor subunit beta [Thiohalocapsa sp.]|jgi:integration host factor subunit beta|uniref:integration host factor subunit beta n=1 Tax=Thiohalocapsa sp. TaxID=2497641 RepID=UPI0025FBA218|nr:integration host factor subunit beta [Thiohalocapsa sp.]MCG6940193.1 integration host factor subunit beta [Thiohalocapsa sp.]